MTTNASRTPAIIGFLFAGAALLGIGFFANRERDSEPDELPSLRILAPAARDTVANPVTLVFVTPADLQLTQQGWTANDLHVHLLIDHVEHMPAAADITRADSTFSWRLPELPPGQHHLYLTWAARHHGNVGPATDTLVIIVKP